MIGIFVIHNLVLQISSLQSACVTVIHKEWIIHFFFLIVTFYVLSIP